MQKRKLQSFLSALAMLVLGIISVFAQQTPRTSFDVTNYRIEAVINPSQNQLQSVADVTFIPSADTRSVTFELNGSLKIETITRIGSTTTTDTTVGTTAKVKNPRPATNSSLPQVTFVQDQVGVSDLGPSVKIDLGEVVPAKTSVTLRFKYAGVLATAEGGPLLTKRLAYVGDKNGYLMYASRWFPFNDYAADLATSDITISIPSGYTVAGASDSPVTPVGGKYRFVQSKPTLLGSLAFGKYTPKTLRYGGFELQFNTKIGTDQVVPGFGELLGKALEFYTKQYGEPDSGKKLIIAQTDDDTLDFYSAPGMIFIADKFFEGGINQFAEERLQREAAYQWWGLSVGLKSFDDAWLSQGLAEYSALELRENGISNAKLEQIQRELLEKSLTFEQTASLLRAPSALDDTSTAYQYIMFGKGAMVFRLLRETLGADKFNNLLRNFLAQYRGKNASIDDFEKLTTQVAGEPMRYFFARWVESTGVPEFSVDYQIIRTKDKKFITRGTVKQNYDNLRLPIQLQLIAEGEGELLSQKIMIDDASADFNIESSGKPIQVIIDPKYRLLRTSEDLKVSSIARRGIEQFKEGNLAEAQQQFEAALKLDRSNTWIYYNLGLLYLEQRNYDMAIDNFKVITTGDKLNARPSWIYVWSFIKLGNAYDAKGDRTRAIAAYKNAETTGDDYDSAQDAVRKFQATPYDPKQKNTTAIR